MRQGAHSGEMSSAMARQLKQKQAGRVQHSEKLRDVLFGEACRHVLERDAGVNKIELAVSKLVQIAGFVYQVLRTALRTLVVACVLDHGGRDIHATHTLKGRGQRLR